MPANIDWHPQLKNILLMEIKGTVSMDEVLDITAKEGDLIKTASQMVHTIIDLRYINGVPKNFLSAIPRITSMPAANHPFSGDKLIVGASGLAETFLNIFSKVGRKLFLFNTMEETFEFLEKRGQ